MIIYEFEILRKVLLEKIKTGAYYVWLDDPYFEKVPKNRNLICRKTIDLLKNNAKEKDRIQYITLKTNENYTTKRIIELVEKLRKEIKIILTIFNEEKEECFILFLDNKNNFKIEQEVKDFFENGVEEYE